MSSEKSKPPPPTLIFQVTSAVHPAFAFLAGAQLDLFSPLKEGPLTVEQLADTLGVTALKLRPLLYALTASEFLTLDNGRFANSDLANHYLVRSSPRYMGDMHELLSFMWEAELQTADSIRAGKALAETDYYTTPKDELRRILQGLHPGCIAAAYALLKRYDFSPYHTLLDVGGGSGGVAIAIAANHPQIEATIVDLPPVAAITQEFVDGSGVSDRVQVVAQDVVQEPIDGSYDVAILRALIQVLGPDEAQEALKHVGEAMNPDGHIYIIGAVLDDSRLSPPGTVAFNLLFLNVYDRGEAYTEHEHRVWLDEAGFEHVERALLPDGNSFIKAQKRS